MQAGIYIIADTGPSARACVLSPWQYNVTCSLFHGGPVVQEYSENVTCEYDVNLCLSCSCQLDDVEQAPVILIYDMKSYFVLRQCRDKFALHAVPSRYFSSARMCLPRSDHIRDALASLRFPERRLHKIAVLSYIILHGTAMPYLSPLVRLSCLPGRRSLVSAITAHLVVPPFKLSTTGRRSFKVATAAWTCPLT